VISSESHQPDRRSDNAAEYVRLFIPRVHRLVKLGYDRLDAKRYAGAEETAITGELVESIDFVLDYPTTKWMRFYSVYDDPPVNEPKRRGCQRRTGRGRRRVDIRLDSSEVSPRTRFRFECKRLGDDHTVSRYLGEDGLGCFVRGDYAREDDRAGMLGYVQSDDEETWAERLEKELLRSAHDFAVRSPWRHAPIDPELHHTYRSTHGRGRGRKQIEIYHTLLLFG